MVVSASKRRGGAPYKYPKQIGCDIKMKKQIVMATVAIMLMGVLIVPPVMASADMKTIDVGGKQLNLIGIETIDRADIIGGKGADYKCSISGNLDPYEGYGYGYSMSEGVQVRIEITHHSPSDADVVLGVMDDEFNLLEYIVDTDHTGRAYFPSSSPFDWYTRHNRKIK